MTARRVGGMVAALLLLCGATAFGATPAPADTVRTNLWLTEALMAEIVGDAAGSLPAAPAAVRLEPRSDDDETLLFAEVAANVLGGLGYEVYAAQQDSAAQGACDAVFGFRVLEVALDYPDVGRTLGIWRRWIDRDVAVSAMLELTEADTGRVLLMDTLRRTHTDRVPDGDFAAVNSSAYEFTSGEPGESGWQSRVEEIVVLGALAGLVAIYFANTRD